MIWHRKTLLLIFIYLIVGCKHSDNLEPLKFEGYEGNPILTPGEPGSWDDLKIALPYVVKHDSAFYLFYLGINNSGYPALGLAISDDGYKFTKFEGNPILAPGGKGPEAYGIGAGVVIWQDSLWVMFYNASERAGWGPGASIGRATAKALTGPWIKDDQPVMIAGRMGEWDSEYIFPGSVIKLDDGSYRMYYSGGADFYGSKNQFVGMAFSRDLKNWKKYNNPATVERPFAESDPVLKTGTKREWDNIQVWTPFVLKIHKSFEMYYSGVSNEKEAFIMSIGYATSIDGITWEKFPGNPVFSIDENLFKAEKVVEVSAECPMLVFQDSVCLMYYDYAIIGNVGGHIGIAKAFLN
ncbi:MAG: hypothetical protein FJY07_11755 [Bacteroidetes bacterium]|nr:hypothetical protein [Bacteroidota bacterium]